MIEFGFSQIIEFKVELKIKISKIFLSNSKLYWKIQFDLIFLNCSS